MLYMLLKHLLMQLNIVDVQLIVIELNYQVLLGETEVLNAGVECKHSYVDRLLASQRHHNQVVPHLEDHHQTRRLY